ncbi:MAG: hypothetical protein PHE78_07910 [Candidatus Gastranaerophilales bacterium]|jgi:hypothetical protein|nr:hypothetical protein [Candidatus Gastranaerophilales bacterium]
MQVNFQNQNVYQAQPAKRQQQTNFKGGVSPANMQKIARVVDIVGWSTFAGSIGISIANFIKRKQEPGSPPQARNLQRALDITCISSVVISLLMLAASKMKKR